MIGRIAGKLLEKQPPMILVDVSGVGYEIHVPMSTFYNLPALGGSVTLHTHLVVREDAHLLFGFGTEEERRAFRELLRVTGVGAKMALAVLSGLSVADLAAAVSGQDAGRLTKVPGIGKKTAERLVLELRDRLGGASTVAAAGAGPNATGSDVINALLALGYNEREASWAVKQLPEGASVSDGIKQALKFLSKS